LLPVPATLEALQQLRDTQVPRVQSQAAVALDGSSLKELQFLNQFADVPGSIGLNEHEVELLQGLSASMEEDENDPPQGATESRAASARENVAYRRFASRLSLHRGSEARSAAQLHYHDEQRRLAELVHAAPRVATPPLPPNEEDENAHEFGPHIVSASEVGASGGFAHLAAPDMAAEELESIWQFQGMEDADEEGQDEFALPLPERARNKERRKKEKEQAKLLYDNEHKFFLQTGSDFAKFEEDEDDGESHALGHILLLFAPLRTHLLETSIALHSNLALIEIAYRYFGTRTGFERPFITAEPALSARCKTLSLLYRGMQSVLLSNPSPDAVSELPAAILRLLDNTQPDTVLAASATGAHLELGSLSATNMLAILTAYTSPSQVLAALPSLFSLHVFSTLCGVLQWAQKQPSALQAALLHSLTNLSPSCLLSEVGLFLPQLFRGTGTLPLWLASMLRWLSLPFLRQAALIQHVCFEMPAQLGLVRSVLDEFALDSNRIEDMHSEFYSLCNYLRLERDRIDLLLVQPSRLDATWLRHLLAGRSLPISLLQTDCLVHMSVPIVPLPLPLPSLYQRLYVQYLGQRCPRCSTVPSEPALCLLCHRYVCLGARCCVTQHTDPSLITHLPPHVQERHLNAEASFHTRVCGAGSGMFLLFRLSSVMLISGDKQCLWSSPYLDAHGEEDILLRRGKALYLNAARVDQLNRMWACGTAFEEAGKDWFSDANLR
jgi:hypothetical protein